MLRDQAIGVALVTQNSGCYPAKLSSFRLQILVFCSSFGSLYTVWRHVAKIHKSAPRNNPLQAYNWTWNLQATPMLAMQHVRLTDDTSKRPLEEGLKLHEAGVSLQTNMPNIARIYAVICNWRNKRFNSNQLNSIYWYVTAERLDLKTHKKHKTKCKIYKEV
jgi:hypothetical protein